MDNASVVITQGTVWGTNGNVRIHAEVWTPDADLVGAPIVFVPGGTGSAYSSVELGRELASGRVARRPRALLGVSRRGTGLSDAPSTGYRPSDFANDVEAAITAAGWPNCVLFGHSMGVPIALEYVLRYPERVSALVLGDTPAAYIDFKAAGTFAPLLKRRFTFASWDDAYADWLTVEATASRERFDRDRGRYFAESGGMIRRLIDRAAIAQTVEESVSSATDYWSRLSEIGCPILVVKGTGAGWSPLSDNDVLRYQMAAPRLAVAYIPGGHGLGLHGDRAPLYDALARVVGPLDP